VTLLHKISLLPDKRRWWTAISITFTVASLLTVIGIYGIGEYGLALFILTPFFVGFSATLMYGYNHHISRTTAIKISAVTITIMMVVLLVFAIEGIICILMATPFVLILLLCGASLGHYMLKRRQSHIISSLLILFLMIPLTGFVEKAGIPGNHLVAVTTSIKINADAKTVWRNVIVFPELDPPTELLFRAGISYPVNAVIKGEGVGALRYCNFTTGSFIEPITRWEAPALLAFDVLQSPAPMTELSFWDVNAPHLHDYFVSKRGQFRLIRISDDETLLEGTTWYYNRIKPNLYWNLWSDYIVHHIHNRVLTHIKATSENNCPVTQYHTSH
jgi:hypothetical protein